MLTIRQEQLQALQQDVQMRQIEAHVREVFPQICNDTPVKDLAERLRAAVARASTYGFTRHTDVQQFVDITFAVGEDFEIREEFRWALEILRDRKTAHAPFRATWLFDRVMQQLVDSENPYARRKRPAK